MQCIGWEEVFPVRYIPPFAGYRGLPLAVVYPNPVAYDRNEMALFCSAGFPLQ